MSAPSDRVPEGLDFRERARFMFGSLYNRLPEGPVDDHRVSEIDCALREAAARALEWAASGSTRGLDDDDVVRVWRIKQGLAALRSEPPR